MQKISITISKAFLLSILFTSTSFAAVSMEEANQLGKKLTPIGAEKAGNKEGTIPAWTGGISKPIPGYKLGDHHPDPFAGDKPLFTITAENYKEHLGKLSPGQIAMFKRYPETWKMPIYPTRRSAAYPDFFYDATKKNALSAELAEGGNGIKGAHLGAPFPIPKSGVEVIWNHITRYRGESLERNVGQVVPHANGAYSLVMFEEKLDLLYSNQNISEAERGNRLLLFKQRVTSPARLAGTVLLVHETLNQVDEPRRAWAYNAGQRRVRRAPQIAYDSPGTASDGQRTSDNFDMFNGAPDRYDWKLIGKKELYIPYNSYKLHSDSLQYDDIIKKNHINTQHARYELHRVWQIEATLKEGNRHVYQRRVFFIDEDSWQAATVDHYDARGELWRVGEAHPVNYYEVPAHWITLETLYDLLSGRYLALGLNNQEEMVEFNTPINASEFTPAALRRSGHR